MRPQVLCGDPESSTASPKVRSEKGRAYADSILPTSSDPGRLGKVEEHIRGLVQCIELSTARIVNVGQFRPLTLWKGILGPTNMKTVPFWLGPLQYCAGKVLLLVQSGCGPTRVSATLSGQGSKGRTYVDAPPEGGDARANDGVLVDRNDLRVREDVYYFSGYCG